MPLEEKLDDCYHNESFLQRSLVLLEEKLVDCCSKKNFHQHSLVPLEEKLVDCCSKKNFHRHSSVLLEEKLDDSDNNKNPVLAEYMRRNATPQGLVPRDNGRTYDYSTIAGEIANIMPNQQAYSSAMIDAAMKGQVPAESVLADNRVLDQAKVGLVNVMRQNQGLGQVAQ